MDKTVFGTRLKLARRMAGMSLQDLADTLQGQITKQSLNKYELGLMLPTSEILNRISKALNLKPDYFLKPTNVAIGEIQFRKQVSLSKKIEEAVIEKARDYIERFLEIENILSLGTKFVNPLSGDVVQNSADVELAAQKLRNVWDLGNAPLSNIVQILEQKGVKVFLIDEVDQFDGFAAYATDGIPLVVVNTKDRSVERVRFTIIHELAHLLLEFNGMVNTDKKLVEKFCHLFSSCFLLPTSQLIDLIGGKIRSYIKIEELIIIKEQFGISIRAIAHRLKELKIITENYYQRWVIYLSKTHGAKHEPGKYKSDEKSKVLDQLINRALAEEIISISKAASLLNVDVSMIRKKFQSD